MGTGLSRTARAHPDGHRRAVRPVINVIVRKLCALADFLPDGVEEGPAGGPRERCIACPAPAAVPAGEEEIAGAEVGSSMRAAAPPVQSFAMGRRR